MPNEVVDGQDVLIMHAAMERAVERARTDKVPTLLEVRTYRFMGHSMSDPIHGHYRTKEEVEDQRKRDPIAVWSQRLIAEGLTDEAGVKAMDKEVLQEVEDAYQFADEAPEPEPEELWRDVYVEEQRDEEERETLKRKSERGRPPFQFSHFTFNAVWRRSPP